MKKFIGVPLFLAFLCICTLVFLSWRPGQPGKVPKKVRLARIVIDSTHLDEYKALLKEGVEAAVKLEPGVLSLYAVFEKEKPTHLTILEMYADEEAYQFHINTPHFQKYKQATMKMVKSLELVETDPLIPALKIK